MLWGPGRPPTLSRDAATLGRWQLLDLADLSACRRSLADALRDRFHPTPGDEGSVQRLVLLLEELGSNALRHGQRPVELAVWSCPSYWLLTVSDAAVESPPVPAMNRDPAQGGMGLYLIARLGDGHGWTVQGDRKIAWVRVNYIETSAETLH